MYTQFKSLQRYWFLLLIGIIIAIIFFVFSNSLIAAPIINPLAVAAALVGVFVLVLVSSGRLILLFWTQKETLSASAAVQIDLMNKFFYVVLPSKLNLIAKVYVGKKLFHLDSDLLASMVSLEFFLDLVFVWSITTVGFFFLAPRLLGDNSFYLEILAVGLFLGLILALLVPVPKIKAHPLLERLFQLIHRVQSVWKSSFRNPRMLLGVLITCFYYLVSALVTYFSIAAFSNPLPSFLVILVVTCASIIIGAASQIPGGLGARDASLVFFLGLFGVPLNSALAATILSRIFYLIPSILGLLLVVFYGGTTLWAKIFTKK